MRAIERVFEVILWNSRFVVLVPVLFSLLLALAVFASTTLDAVYQLGNTLSYFNPAIDAATRVELRLTNTAELVAIVDGYLLAAIMLIFSLGLYELFVNKIDIAEGSDFANRLLLIRNLDDLKDRLANVILLILIVKFFQQALELKYETTVDLLILGIGVVLVAGTLYLSVQTKAKKSELPEFNKKEK